MSFPKGRFNVLPDVHEIQGKHIENVCIHLVTTEAHLGPTKKNLGIRYIEFKNLL